MLAVFNRWRYLLGVIAVLLPCSAGFADFVNGDFETGTFSGWTLDHGLWLGDDSYFEGTDAEYPPPIKSAIMTPGTDPNTNNVLNMVYAGNYAARVNDQYPQFDYSSLSQTVTDWQHNDISFAWAAVLENPAGAPGTVGEVGAIHDSDETPRFSLQLVDDTRLAFDLANSLPTTDSVLKDVSFDVYNADQFVDWHTGASVIGHSGVDSQDPGVWMYSSWQSESVDTSQRIGDTFTLTVLATDCGEGGHAGYAYVDDFGYSTPEISPVLLLTSVLPIVGWRLRRRRKTA